MSAEAQAELYATFCFHLKAFRLWQGKLKIPFWSSNSGCLFILLALIKGILPWRWHSRCAYPAPNRISYACWGISLSMPSCDNSTVSKILNLDGSNISPDRGYGLKILDHVALCNINKANFRYPDDYSFRLMQALICCAAAEADTQFAIFPWYAPKKQCPIFAICSS